MSYYRDIKISALSLRGRETEVLAYACNREKNARFFTVSAGTRRHLYSRQSNWTGNRFRRLKAYMWATNGCPRRLSNAVG